MWSRAPWHHPEVTAVSSSARSATWGIGSVTHTGVSNRQQVADLEVDLEPELR